jgi:DNA polymerase-3 subunit beta
VATDSHRLSRQQARVEGAEELTLNNVIIPAKSLTELAKTFTDYSGNVDIIVSENQILVKTDEISFYSRLLDGTYPDISRVIPRSGETELVSSTRELLQSVDRAFLISRDGGDNVIKWTIKDGAVKVQSIAREIGSVNEEVMARVTGREMSISFNARYMMEALRSIESEEVRIQFTGTMTPFLIQPTDREDSLHIIVPTRTHA